MATTDEPISARLDLAGQRVKIVEELLQASAASVGEQALKLAQVEALVGVVLSVCDRITDLCEEIGASAQEVIHNTPT